MYRQFIALVLSAALAVTGMTAQPAHAGNDDVAKWIAGLAVLGIIGAAIADDRKKSSRQTYQQNNVQKFKHTPKKYKHKSKKHRRNHMALPARCRVTERMQGKEVRGFRRGCLKRHDVDVRNLPRHCALKVRDRQTGNRRVIYTSRCMRQQGYSVARGY